MGENKRIDRFVDRFIKRCVVKVELKMSGHVCYWKNKNISQMEHFIAHEGPPTDVFIESRVPKLMAAFATMMLDPWWSTIPSYEEPQPVSGEIEWR